ncbi:MAG: hypothetical protein QOJ79_1924 [Actinomycetota bacterium]|jgi:hypothetical protein|nr:hypothetical protein [Actinomycetota bacterium]
MRRRGLVSIALAAGVVALAVPSQAAGGLTVTDAVGDANGLNSQALGLPVPSTSTAPADVAAADITSLAFKTVYRTVGGRRVPHGFTITLKLAAAPTEDVLYGLTADISSTCDGTNSTMQFGHQDLGPLSTDLAVCQQPAGSAGTAVDIGTTEVDAAKQTITWTVNPDAPIGAKVTNIQATTSVFVLGVFDELTSPGTFVYGK